MRRALAAVVFDVNETLVRMDGVARALADQGAPKEAFPLWFAQILRDGFALAACDRFVRFPDVARAHLRALFVHREDSEQRVERVMAAFRTLEPHGDVRPAFDRLSRAGLAIVTLTNGTASLSRQLLERAGLMASVHAVFDAGHAKAWKPRPEPYWHVADALGVAPSELALVAVHPWDVQGAQRAGLVGAWVNRAGAAWPEFMERPHRSGGTLVEAAEALLAATPASR